MLSRGFFKWFSASVCSHRQSLANIVVVPFMSCLSIFGLNIEKLVDNHMIIITSCIVLTSHHPGLNDKSPKNNPSPTSTQGRFW